MIELQIVISDVQKQMVAEIITKYHSYVPSAVSVGRRIDWLIYHSEVTNKFGLKKPIGMIGLGSSVYPPPKDLLNRVGLSKYQYKDNFNSFANNWRFCLKTSVKNAGTQILKELRKQAPIEWKKKYNDELKYIITFVGGGNNGAVYKADNWEMVGYTAGLPEHKPISMKWDTNEALKKKFVIPTGENKKMIFLKEIN